jgi:hypothetical protein
LFQIGCHITKEIGDLEMVSSGYPTYSDPTTVCVRAMINRIMKAAITAIILVASALTSRSRRMGYQFKPNYQGITLQHMMMANPEYICEQQVKELKTTVPARTISRNLC